MNARLSAWPGSRLTLRLFWADYRVYYTQRGKVLLLLLVGGDKSTQTRDIAKAVMLARGYEE